MGPEPFSETETRTLSEYIASIHKQLVGYLSIHSYSQLLLIPYGYSNAHVENYEELVTSLNKVQLKSPNQNPTILMLQWGQRFNIAGI